MSDAIEYRKTKDLFNWKDNPRAIKKDKFEELKSRITRHGQIKPLIITKQGEVLGGNMRLRAMKELGIDEAWVSVVSPATEAEKIEIALTDNEEMGYYEDKALAELIDKYKDDIDLAKYSVHLSQPKTLEEILREFSPEEIIEDEAPEVSDEEPISKLGEVYQLGRHRLMCGDSTKIEDVEKLMDGNKADMVFTDPPYGLGGYGGRNMDGIMGDDHDDIKKFYDACFNLIPFLNRNEMYIWGGAENLRLHLLDKPRDVIVWVKNNFGLGRGYRGQYELCFYYGDFKGSDSDVWDQRKDTDYKHPTQKPVALAARAIKNSNPDSVLDIYGGSGSTLIACEQTDRTCYMMELDPKYCDVIRKRYENFINANNAVKTGK